MNREPLGYEDLLIIETADFDNANNDGTITVPSGEETTLVEYEPPADDVHLLHALGAADAQEVRYRLRHGQEISHTTESPLGLITDPHSFTDSVGAPLATRSTVQYVAINDSASDVDLAARMHVELP